MAENAAYLANRLEVGRDGKTVYQRSRGRKTTVKGLEFGEKMLWKVCRANKRMKVRPRWEFGIMVGVRRRMGILGSRREKRNEGSQGGLANSCRKQVGGR